MCERPRCPYMADVMCSCDAITSGKAEAMTIYIFQNIIGLKMELSYGTLETPAPYRLCAAGVCKVCGGRLCVGVELPDHLQKDGFLAVVYYHMERLRLDVPGLFAGLFHEEDRPCVRRWLERKSLSEQERIS